VVDPSSPARHSLRGLCVNEYPHVVPIGTPGVISCTKFVARSERAYSFRPEIKNAWWRRILETEEKMLRTMKRVLPPGRNEVAS
jgi:hypothetical protein